jgi:ABC-type nitrate/sulfonate/bicarbonate transport system permease component
MLSNLSLSRTGVVVRSRPLRRIAIRALVRSRRYVLLLLLLLGWQVWADAIYPAHNPASRNILPPPSDVLAMAFETYERGELIPHILTSLRRVAIGFSLASLLAVSLTASLILWPLWRRQVLVVVDMLRPIPPFAWIPIGLLLFGVGDAQCVFVIIIAAFFPILMNATAGADAIDPVLVRAAMSLGAKRRDVLLHVVLPDTLPSLFVGLRLGLGYAWMVLVASELIGAASGLGYMINDSRNLGLPSLAMVGMAAIALVGYALDLLVCHVEVRVRPWRR